MNLPFLWKIYYSDKSTFSDKDGSAFDAPRTEVQVITYWNPNTGKYDRTTQADKYYYEPERADWAWWHCDAETMVLHLIRAKQPLIFFGAMVPTQIFNEVEAQALADIPAGMKGVWRPRMDKQDAGVVNDE